MGEADRRIMHMDMDAFYASVEQLDNPELRGKPVIVGGTSDRGVVSACSYEARAFGIHSAMPSVRARKLCPQGIFVHGRMNRYIEVSQQIMALLDRYSPLVEQVSVDEAYLDITGTEKLHGPPRELALAIKRGVLEGTGLKCSIGIAPVKFLAKIASDYNKPDGLFILEQEDVEAFLRTIPIKKVPGVGKRTLENLDRLGIRTPADMLRYPRHFWLNKFGKWGGDLFDKAQGIDPRPVVTSYEPKSESAENTFSEDTSDRELLRTWLMAQSERVGRHLRQGGHAGRTITLKIKYADFKSITRSRTLSAPTNATKIIFETACSILQGVDLPKKVRLIGVGVSNFDSGPTQLSLPTESSARDTEKLAELDKALDAIQERHGGDAIKRARLVGFKDRRWNKDPEEDKSKGKGKGAGGNR